MFMIKLEFLKKIEKELGKDKYESFLKSFNEPSKHGFSVNLRKLKKSTIDLDYIIDRFDAKLVFKNDKFAYLIYDKEKLEKKNIYPGKDPLFHAGLYYIQEPSAAKVLFGVDFNKSDAVLDMCASPGGKSCMSLYNLDTTNGGFLVANEIKIDRARVLSSNLERMGFDNVIVTCNSPNELSRYFNCFFDKIIVDAPCSGEGMFKKSKEAVNQWSEELVKSCSSIQKDILDNAVSMLKPGGLIIYSTCTFSHEEDEDNVLYVTEKYKDMKLLHMEKLYPHESFGDGQFFAYMKKDGAITINSMFPSKKDLKGLNVLRYGVKLIDEKNGTQTVSHAITHIDGQDIVKDYIELNDDEIIKYLHGDVIRKETTIQGLCIITYKNLGVGLAKVSSGVIKNHYPKGLRILY